MKMNWITTALLCLVSAHAFAEETKAAKKHPATPADAKAAEGHAAHGHAADAKGAEAMPMPTLPPEGKRWVEGMVGNWKGKDVVLKMGDQEMKGSISMKCEKASEGWATLCKAQFDLKGMPRQVSTFLFAWSIGENEAVMFEASNMADTHDHRGKWSDDKNISVVHTGKNFEGKEETDKLTMSWASPKEVKITGEGTQGTTTAWSFDSVMKK